MEAHLAFNTLDYIVMATILLSGLLAIFSGFVREMYSLFNWGASAFMGAHYHRFADPLVSNYISNPATIKDASIFVVFCATFIVLGLIGAAINQFLIKGKALTAIDRSLGFVFGLIRGVLMVCIVYLVVKLVLWPDMDKIPTATVSGQQEASTGTEKAKSKNAEKTPAPQWIMNARTRPLVAKGAALLEEFVPKEELEKATTDFMGKKKAMEQKVDDSLVSREDQALYDDVQKHEKEEREKREK